MQLNNSQLSLIITFLTLLCAWLLMVSLNKHQEKELFLEMTMIDEEELPLPIDEPQEDIATDKIETHEAMNTTMEEIRKIEEPEPFESLDDLLDNLETSTADISQEGNGDFLERLNAQKQKAKEAQEKLKEKEEANKKDIHKNLKINDH